MASRRLIDDLRAEPSRREREGAVSVATPQSELVGAPADADPAADRDDSLALLSACCHPSLPAPSQIALTLRAVGGLTTAQIAAAFLVPEATMARRISRAKQAIKASGARSDVPGGPALAERLSAVLHVLYLIFSECYTATAGERHRRWRTRTGRRSSACTTCWWSCSPTR